MLRRRLRRLVGLVLAFGSDFANYCSFGGGVSEEVDGVMGYISKKYKCELSGSNSEL
jgi:hypothetical protein